MIRVLIADDDVNVREALSDLLASDPDITIVGLAADAVEAKELAEAFHPDAALIDVRMPRGGGTTAVREIKRVSPDTKVAALSAYDDRTTVLDMLSAGAIGYIVKGAPGVEVIQTIHQISRGESSLSGGVAAEIVRELSGQLERDRMEFEAKERQEDSVKRVIRSGFRMHLQPIYALDTGRAVAVEALARFDEETPGHWFATAAACGLSDELELACIRQALSQLAALPPDIGMTLNVSPKTAADGRLMDLLRDFPADRLTLEITEHAVVEDYDDLLDCLAAFRFRGGRLAIDDAGAGYASLRHILRLRPEVIKLDIGMVHGVDVDPARRALVVALVSFAAEIEATLVAEGIETEGELEIMKQSGIPWGQGFLLSHPKALEDLGPALRTYPLAPGNGSRVARRSRA